jgi:hypothetical protein
LIPTLADWIIERASELSSSNSKEDKHVAEDVLKTLGRLDTVELTGRQGIAFEDALKKFALEGETEKQGRRATVILLKMKRQELHVDELTKVNLPYSPLTIGNHAFIKLRKRILCHKIGNSV